MCCNTEYTQHLHFFLLQVMRMKFSLLKRSMRGKDTEAKEEMVTERKRRGEMGGEKDHPKQQNRKKNYRQGLRKERRAGERDQGVIKKQKEERRTRRSSPK